MACVGFRRLKSRRAHRQTSFAPPSGHARSTRKQPSLCPLARSSLIFGPDVLSYTWFTRNFRFRLGLGPLGRASNLLSAWAVSVPGCPACFKPVCVSPDNPSSLFHRPKRFLPRLQSADTLKPTFWSRYPDIHLLNTII